MRLLLFYISCRKIQTALCELAHVNLAEAGLLDALGNPVLLFLVERKDRLSHQSALEDAALIQGLFQSCVSFAGGLAAAVDRLGDVVDPVGPVLSLFQGVLVRVSKPMRAPSMPGNQLTQRVSSWQVMREISGHSSRRTRTSCS